MAFATGGDTVNATSRLQALTRDLDATVVARAELVNAVEREAPSLRCSAVWPGAAPRAPRS